MKRYGPYLHKLRCVSMAKNLPVIKSKKPRHYVRQWRKHRGYTLEQLAQHVGVTQGAIAQLERGEVGYTQSMLEALAYNLRCKPADLIMRDPTEPAGLWSLWRGLSPDQKQEAINYLRLLTARTASSG